MAIINKLHIKFFSIEDLHSVDPLGKGLDWFHHHFPAKATLEQPSPLFKETPEVIIDKYVQRFLSDKEYCNRHAPILDYERELVSKCSRQGGLHPFADVRENFESYYLVEDDVQFGKVAEVGLETFLRMIDGAVDRNGYPQVYYTYQTANTAFGSPFGGYKSNVYHHQQWPSNNGWWHPLPIWPNTRNMRSRTRCVFAASAFDCDYLQPSLTAVRCWLKVHFPNIFGAWRNPRDTLYRDIGLGVIRNKWFLETDFKAMDTHFSLAVVKKLILPIYQHLLSPADYLHFAQYVEECFSQPLQVGTQLWTGLHNLFSGLPFTNDFETLYDVVIYLGAHVLAGQEVSDFQFVFKACGDDVVYHGDKLSVMKVYDLVRGEFTLNGVILSEEKTRIQQGECRFCRQVYYPACRREYTESGEQMLIPAYPFILTLNSCVQPEKTAETRSNELLNAFTRLDNAVGHYRFKDAVMFVFNNMTDEAKWPLRPGSMQEFETIQRKDWWYKVYGTTYTLGESPSYELFCNLLSSLHLSDLHSEN